MSTLNGCIKEGFIFPNWSAESGVAFVPAKLRTISAGWVQKEVVSVEDLILKEVRHLPSNSFVPNPRDHLDIRSAVAACSCGVQSRLCFHGFQDVERRRQIIPKTTAAVHQIGRIGAIDYGRIIGRTRAINRWVERLRSIISLRPRSRCEIPSAAGAIRYRSGDYCFTYDEMRIVA